MEDDYTTHSLYISLWPFHSQVQKVHSSNPFKEKCISGVVRIGSIIIFHLSQLLKAKFSILCDVVFLVSLQEKFQLHHSWEWKGWKVGRLYFLNLGVKRLTRSVGVLLAADSFRFSSAANIPKLGASPNLTWSLLLTLKWSLPQSTSRASLYVPHVMCHVIRQI